MESKKAVEDFEKITFYQYKLNTIWNLIRAFDCKKIIQYTRDYNVLKINNIFILKFNNYSSLAGKLGEPYFQIYILNNPMIEIENTELNFNRVDIFTLVYTSDGTDYSGCWLKYGPWISIFKREIENFIIETKVKLEMEYKNSDINENWEMYFKNVWKPTQ